MNTQEFLLTAAARPAPSVLDALARELADKTGEPYEEIRQDVEIAAGELGREALAGDVRSWP